MNSNINVCCSNKGNASLKAKFSKNVFTPQETAHGQIELDNSSCQARCMRVTFAILQQFSQKIEHHTYRDTITILDSSSEGPAAGQGDWKQESVLEMSKIKYEVADMKKKKGVQKKVSLEDKFLMASLQPACHAPKFTNEYILKVQTHYEGCICSDTPHAEIKMTIVPLLDPACFCSSQSHSFTELAHYSVNPTHDPDQH